MKIIKEIKMIMLDQESDLNATEVTLNPPYVARLMVDGTEHHLLPGAIAYTADMSVFKMLDGHGAWQDVQ